MERVEIPGLRVRYKKLGFLNIFNSFSELKPLKDIHLNGACFEIDKPLKQGDIICLEISAGKNYTINVSGNTKWISGLPYKNTECAGVQFFQYGCKERYDAVTHMERLKLLTENIEPELH